MKAARFTEEQIIIVLKEAEAGTSARELCRRHGIAEQIFYRWKSSCGPGLERVMTERGVPTVLVLDNGPECHSRQLAQWAQARGITLRFIEPGKPTQNAYVKSFNGKVRDECLNEHWFESLAHARQMLERWRPDYNRVRPHSALANAPPAMLAANIEQGPTAAAREGMVPRQILRRDSGRHDQIQTDSTRGYG